MALAIERFKNPINIDSLLTVVRGLIRMEQKAVTAVPWASIWDSTIPHSVINRTAGLCFTYQAAIDLGVTPEQNSAVAVWRARTRKDLLRDLNQTPEARIVYARLKQAYMITIDAKETLREKCRRIMKGGV